MQITFSGRLGSGKSTVCKILNEKYGYEIYSTGTVQRKIAEEMGVSTLEMNVRMENNSELDFMIDNTVARISRERKGEKLVFDSRMAWHFAENTFKVYMYVDPTVAGKRVFATDRGAVEKYESVQDAKEKLLARTFAENKRYKSIYGVDNLDYNNYNLILDSTMASAEEIADSIALYAEKYLNEKFDKTVVLLSSHSILPTKSPEDAETDNFSAITVRFIDGIPFCVSGHSLLKKALESSERLVSVLLDTGNEHIELSSCIAHEYEAAFGFTYETKPE